MKTRALSLGAASLAAIFLLAGCESVKVSSWSDPEFAGRPIGKTMILGVGESDTLSRQYESLFVEALTEIGAESASLHATTQSTEQIGEEALVALLRADAFDSIIVTRVISQTERQQMSMATRYPAHYGDYYGFYSHAYRVSYNTADIETFVEFELESNLYDVATRKLVWTGRKILYDDRSDLTNMKTIVKGVIKDLVEKGMID